MAWAADLGINGQENGWYRFFKLKDRGRNDDEQNLYSIFTGCRGGECFGGVMLAVVFNGGLLAPGQIAWWKFEEGSGTTAFDSSGQNHNGTITNMSAADIGVTGKFENGLEFDTSNNHVFVPSDIEWLPLITFPY